MPQYRVKTLKQTRLEARFLGRPNELRDGDPKRKNRGMVPIKPVKTGKGEFLATSTTI